MKLKDALQNLLNGVLQTSRGIASNKPHNLNTKTILADAGLIRAEIQS